MPESSVTPTTPTTIAEFRRLANAFLSGSRFPAGTTVYIIASTTGTRPIQAIINASSSTAYAEVVDALGVQSPPGFTANEAAHRVVYSVVVPDVDRLSVFDPGRHGSTGYDKAVLRAGSATPPNNATFGQIAAAEIRVTWSNDGGTSIYDLDSRTDAFFSLAAHSSCSR